MHETDDVSICRLDGKRTGSGTAPDGLRTAERGRGEPDVSPRIAELYAAALARDDPRQAVLGVLESDLLVSQAATAKIIRAELAVDESGLELLQDLAPALDLQLRLTKQIVQISQLVDRMEQRREQSRAESRGKAR